MIFDHPKLLLVIAILLMVFGLVMPFLMVLKLVESTFFLNFLSYASSTSGFFLGFISLAAWRVKHKKKDDDKDQYK
jgi:positive regulator of sigma E activity